MCPSPHSTPSLGRGLRRFISELSVQACIRGLRALTDRIVNNRYSSISELGSSEGNCQLPLSRSQSLLLAEVVTTCVPHLTWWSTLEESDLWVLCGEAGEGSGPRVTVFISAISDKDVLS